MNFFEGSNNNFYDSIKQLDYFRIFQCQHDYEWNICPMGAYFNKQAPDYESGYFMSIDVYNRKFICACSNCGININIKELNDEIAEYNVTSEPYRGTHVPYPFLGIGNIHCRDYKFSEFPLISQIPSVLTCYDFRNDFIQYLHNEMFYVSCIITAETPAVIIVDYLNLCDNEEHLFIASCIHKMLECTKNNYVYYNFVELYLHE